MREFAKHLASGGQGSDTLARGLLEFMEKTFDADISQMIRTGNEMQRKNLIFTYPNPTSITKEEVKP